MTVLKSQLQQQGSGDPGLSEEVVNLREKLRVCVSVSTCSLIVLSLCKVKYMCFEDQKA